MTPSTTDRRNYNNNTKRRSRSSAETGNQKTFFISEKMLWLSSPINTLLIKERPKIKLRPKIVTFTSFYNCKALNTSYMRSFNICLTTPSIIKEQPPVSFSVITFEAILQFFVREKELI